MTVSFGLPSKFDSFILNGLDSPTTEEERLKKELDQIYLSNECTTSKKAKKQLKSLKNGSTTYSHIRTGKKGELNNWILKFRREDEIAKNSTFDAHIYRVRKTEKVRAVIKDYHLSGIVVPRKYLYQIGFSKEWFVVAQRLELLKNTIIDNDYHREENVKTLSPDQARALSILIFKAGLGDLTNNIGFTKKGEMALFDIEPTQRFVKKEAWKSWMNIFPDAKATFKLTSYFEEAEKLRYLCSDPLAKQAVNRIQRKELFIHLTKLVISFALPILAAVALAKISLLTANPLIFKLAYTVSIVAGLNTLRVSSLALSTLHQYFCWSTAAGQKALNLTWL